jgi:hypothetical protein
MGRAAPAHSLLQGGLSESDTCRPTPGWQGEKGGGLFMDSCATSVVNCTFDANTASQQGARSSLAAPRLPLSWMPLEACAGDYNFRHTAAGAAKYQKARRLKNSQQHASGVPPSLCDAGVACPGGGLYRSAPTGHSVIRASRFTKNKALQLGGAIYEANVPDGAIQARKPLLCSYLHLTPCKREALLGWCFFANILSCGREVVHGGSEGLICNQESLRLC